MSRVAALAKVKQCARISIVEVVPHFIRIRIRRQAVECKSSFAGAIKDVERGLYILAPLYIAMPKPDIEDAAGNTVIRFNRRLRGQQQNWRSVC